MLNKYLDVAPEVRQALDEGRPVVALESTIISHGMPYPQNVETALNVEKIIRDNGAVPATIAVIGGRLKAGLSPEEINYLGKTGTAVAKATATTASAETATSPPIPNDSSAPTPAAVTRPSHMKIWRTPRSMPNSQIAETP